VAAVAGGVAVGEVIESDVLQWAANYDGPKFHSLFCDPPYHLTSITKRFGKQDSVPAQYGKDGAYQRASTGFMGQKWDGGNVAFRPETWAALAEHLYPGAFSMAFASSRGMHRMACAIEDAGLILHPTIVYAFGSGFPKATRIDTQIDRAMGAEREIIGRQKAQGNTREKGAAGHYANSINSVAGNKEIVKDGWDITAPSTPLAKAWAGHRYGGQVLKPALEFLIVFQKPYSGRPIDNITETGAGALNVEGGRVPVDPEVDDMLRAVSRQERKSETWKDGSGFKNESNPLTGVPEGGRWPSNLILDDSESVREMFPETKSGSNKEGSIQGRGKDGIYSDYNGFEGKEYEANEGSAARFFYQTNWNYEAAEALNNADPIHYCAKPGRKERDAGLDSEPMQTRNRVNSGGLENEKRWAPVEARNIHPTVKPISLCKYLATLLLPPVEYAPRRIIDPFCGSGSNLIGAMLGGWDEIVGIDMSPEYVQIARARLAWWAGWVKDGQTDIETILGQVEEEKTIRESGQRRLF
jgi:site-specific DNA-methyltransferase (adenine-specific)